MSDTQSIKDKIDIVDFIGEYVQLKPAGVNHKARCPFHHEKTPSFMVNRERQSFHCFGCGKGGDVFTFVQEMEGMEFVEALRHLAARAGVELTFQDNRIETSQKNRIKEINTEAARFFHNFSLKMNQAKGARDYLHSRGVEEETIIEWQIGYVSNQWDLLTQYLLKKGHSIDDLVAAGLTIKKEGADFVSKKGFYDRFRGRIMFPIWDIHGSVVGFTGRQLIPDDRSGKYVNTPQTLVYDKSRVVFGLNKAKQEIRRKDLVVVVEGQMDVIACYQAGMKNVAASSGTALTEHHVGLLKRYSQNLNVAFDADAAGESAAKRGIDLAVQEGMNVRVIQIPEGRGKDPDECLKLNPTVWFDAVENAKNIMEWHFERILRNKNMADPKQKQAAVNQLLPEIALIPYAVERDHWMKELSAKLGVEAEVLREDVGRVVKKKKPVLSNQYSVSAMDKVLVEKNRLDLLIERFFVLILRFQNFGFRILDLEFDELSTSKFFSLYTAIKKQYNDNNKIGVAELRQQADSEEKRENLVDILLMKGELDFSVTNEDEAQVEIDKTLAEIKKELNKKRRQELQVEIERAEKAGDKERLQDLLNKFQSIVEL